MQCNVLEIQHGAEGRGYCLYIWGGPWRDQLSAFPATDTGDRTPASDPRSILQEHHSAHPPQPSPAQSLFAASWTPTWTVTMTWPDMPRPRKRLMNLEKKYFFLFKPWTNCFTGDRSHTGKIKEKPGDKWCKIEIFFSTKASTKEGFNNQHELNSKNRYLCLNAQIFLIYVLSLA